MEVEMDKDVKEQLENSEAEEIKEEVKEEVKEETKEEQVEEKQEMEEEKPKIIRRRKVEVERDKGVGLDVGTMFCIAASSIDNEATFRVQRDAFFDIENTPMSRGMLQKLNANYIESEDERSLYVVGDEALQMANVFNREIRRPLSGGVVSTREKEALGMIKVILHSLLGDPIEDGEVCHFSVPAQSLDAEGQNVVYHENMLKSFISSFGYKAISMNEAYAIVWSELEDQNFSGLALSFGAGMVNACLSFMGVTEEAHQFSASRSGDWIDHNAATALGLVESKITAIKEGGIDLLNPNGREQTAIKIYYDNLISYVCNALAKNFERAKNIPNFPEPITVVVSGGTSQILNFDKAFRQELNRKKLPFQIKEVRKAKDPLNAVAKGCLLNSLNHYSE